jgi:hypothetical protein
LRAGTFARAAVMVASTQSIGAIGPDPLHGIV